LGERKRVSSREEGEKKGRKKSGKLRQNNPKKFENPGPCPVTGPTGEV